MCFRHSSQFCDGARKNDVFGALFGGFWLPISLRLASQGLPEGPHGPPKGARGSALWGTFEQNVVFNDFRLFWGSPKYPAAVRRLDLWAPGKTPLRHLKQ